MRILENYPKVKNTNLYKLISENKEIYKFKSMLVYKNFEKFEIDYEFDEDAGRNAHRLYVSYIYNNSFFKETELNGNMYISTSKPGNASNDEINEQISYILEYFIELFKNEENENIIRENFYKNINKELNEKTITKTEKKGKI